jgi:hypothetical protein
MMIERSRILFLSAVLFAYGAGCSSASSGSGSPTGGGQNPGTGGSATAGGAGNNPGAGGANNTASTGSVGGAGAVGGTDSTGGAGPSGTGGSAGDTDSGAGDAAMNPFPDFGPNVLIFDPTMPMDMIQTRIDAIVMQQQTSQFGTARYAYFFKPGQYNLDVRLGYYMQVLGLGQSPDDVTITGAVRTKADYRTGGNALVNFWRGAENLAVVPQQDTNIAVWAVSQGTFLRRMHILGPLHLWETTCVTPPCTGYSSGGFIADSKIDGQVNSGTQQQFLSRNTDWASWAGANWNMVFVGAQRPPAGAWPATAYTVVARTPLIREKPFLFVDANGKYFVSAPASKRDSLGIGWAPGAAAQGVVPIDQFYLARPERDTAATINAALGQGKNLIFTPGVYKVDDTIRVTRPGTIVLGLGIPTLLSDMGIPVMTIADVDGVQIGGILFDAGATDAPTLLEVGAPGSTQDHSTNPTYLYDTFCRIGGATIGTATSCAIINSNNVVADHLWMWRADHGAGAAWIVNRSKNGLIVNGNDVFVYGLFVEHFQEYQTLWNGNGGHLFFYQSEMPYDPPTQADWQHDSVNGFSSYKVAATVQTHEAWGLGMYSAFRTPVILDNTVETAIAPGVAVHHAIAVWITGAAGSSITHVINGTGNSVPQTGREAKTPN